MERIGESRSRIAIWILVILISGFTGFWFAGLEYFGARNPIRDPAITGRIDSLLIYIDELRAVNDSLELYGQRIDTVIQVRYKTIQKNDEKIDAAPVDSVITVLRNIYGPGSIR